MLTTALEYYVLICLPLLVLSANWHRLLPLAIVSLLLPGVLCGLAGAQARLPVNKRHWWSRPLVALLFLLHPIVRGWARYRGRFTLPSRSRTAGESLDSLALFNSGGTLSGTIYESDTPLNRIDFVRDLISRLDKEHWPNKPDIGWSEFDVEVYGSLWSSVQITTAVDPSGLRTLRCKLKPRWSLPSLVLFWSLLAAELLFIGLFSDWRPWSWGLLVTLPLFIWFVRRRHRELQSRCTALLDTMAREQGLKKPGAGQSRNGAQPDSDPKPAPHEPPMLPHQTPKPQTFNVKR